MIYGFIAACCFITCWYVSVKSFDIMARLKIIDRNIERFRHETRSLSEDNNLLVKLLAEKTRTDRERNREQ